MTPDLTLPSPHACIHRGVRVDPAALAGCALATGDARSGTVSAIATALRFPTYFGGSWDALDECLNDLAEWWPARGWILVLDGVSSADQPLLEACWRDAAAVHAAAGRSLHLVYP